MYEQIPGKPQFGQSSSHVVRARVSTGPVEIRTSRARYEREENERRVQEMRAAALAEERLDRFERAPRKKRGFFKSFLIWTVLSTVVSSGLTMMLGDKMPSLLGGGDMASMISTAVSMADDTVMVGDKKISLKGAKVEDVMAMAQAEATRIVNSGDQAAIQRLQDQLKSYQNKPGAPKN